MLEKTAVKNFLVRNAPFFIILFGAAFVTFSIGPYQNYDAQLEFEAASNVLKQGLPYVKDFGLINQPPLGFYTEALFFKIFSSSIDIGTALVALFGLVSTVLVYMVGKQLYSKSTGLFAAALFALSPWEIILSRSFLIDAQCLFFSLLCFFVGTFATRRGSVKLSLAAGLFFSAALMTKLCAIFVLLPLFLFYLYCTPKNQKLIFSQLVAFIIPALASALLWYQLVLGNGLPSMFSHIDFSKLNPVGTVVSPFFVGTFLFDYALGPFFLAATALSLLLCFSFRKHFSKILAFDMICLVTVGFIVVLDLVLGAGLNLNAPYISAIKYDYQALPFFCLLAASLAAKSVSLLKTSKLNVAPKKILLYLLGLAGLALIAASLIFNMLYVHTFSTLNYFLFRVARGVNYGYGLFNYSPIQADSVFMVLQYVGFSLVLCGLLLASWHKLRLLFKRRNAQ